MLDRAYQVGPFLVDGIGIGSTVEEARQALTPRHVLGIARTHYRDGKVVVCSGNRLDFCGRELLHRGQSVQRLDQLLGASDFNPYAGARYGPGETVNKRLYFRWGYVVEALVSNDVFIRAHYTPVEQQLLCGKWRGKTAGLLCGPPARARSSLNELPPTATDAVGSRRL